LAPGFSFPKVLTSSGWSELGEEARFLRRIKKNRATSDRRARMAMTMPAIAPPETFLLEGVVEAVPASPLPLVVGLEFGETVDVM
jgi:hypothetical protein